MKIYAISRSYLPLVDVDFSLNIIFFMLGSKPISKKSISTHDLKATFNASTKAGALIVCDHKEDALILVNLFLTANNTRSVYVESDIKRFGSPVVYTIDIDETTLPQQTILTAEDIADYPIKSTIPEHPNDSSLEHDNRVDMYTRQLNKISNPVYIRKVSGLELGSVVSADYVNAEGTRMLSANLTSASESLGLFARIGNMFAGAVEPDASPEARQTLK